MADEYELRLKRAQELQKKQNSLVKTTLVHKSSVSFSEYNDLMFRMSPEHCAVIINKIILCVYKLDTLHKLDTHIDANEIHALSIHKNTLYYVTNVHIVMLDLDTGTETETEHLVSRNENMAVEIAVSDKYVVVINTRSIYVYTLPDMAIPVVISGINIAPKSSLSVHISDTIMSISMLYTPCRISFYNLQLGRKTHAYRSTDRGLVATSMQKGTLVVVTSDDENDVYISTVSMLLGKELWTSISNAASCHAIYLQGKAVLRTNNSIEVFSRISNSPPSIIDISTDTAEVFCLQKMSIFT